MNMKIKFQKNMNFKTKKTLKKKKNQLLAKINYKKLVILIIFLIISNIKAQNYLIIMIITVNKVKEFIQCYQRRKNSKEFIVQPINLYQKVLPFLCLLKNQLFLDHKLHIQDKHLSMLFQLMDLFKQQKKESQGISIIQKY
ncbi:hypothetical protein IMG5_023430 [Ichthyophthirius multifiliis]|uniref:Uncharacterized protein n=1 Tax=Ichthyophthirius multifiliis TaxID=5932 RepID=G0QKW8_ICHMU|nr:hypothetical protein IMG5_023430 [Ichthyophthirius multifiliis]EGR34119.1 hypothetical protein IMG5_023430 [Ichthyophthirius multifiliis]|eukprot:XP_004039423.1 hypothetical protein IMG5_023430 [Ichthyophthirius multifiliis]